MKILKDIRMLANVFGRGVFPHQMTWILGLPGRGLIMSAETVAQRLPLKPDARVLEIGAGSGYYSVAVAKRIPYGVLTLLDIQPEMLEQSAQRLQLAGVSNFTTQVADGKALPFEDESFDVIFLVTVFGEISEQDAFLSEAHRVLAKHGVLSITEHHPDPDFESQEAVVNAVQKRGFIPLQRLGWRWAFTLNCLKVDSRAEFGE